MGIIFKQSLKNTTITYLGFAIGAINTLFLYTRFLTDEYYGLVGVILSSSAILMPLMAFGVPNTLVKYYSNFNDSKSADGFLTLMVLLPLLIVIPLAGVSYFANEAIGNFLARKNVIVKDYVWYIFLIGLAMAYFEIFYAWSKVQMKSVFGNFMKEVFVRVGVSLLLILLFMEFISVDLFLKALVGLYLFRTILMKLYAYSLKRPKLWFSWPKNTNSMVNYSILIILGGSTAVILLEIDRFMINQFIPIQNVAYYTVAIFIATVIAVPARAMHQITYPMTAEILNRNDMVELKRLYQKSSLTLFIVSGLIFILILLNLNDLYSLLPKAYRGGYIIVLLIGCTKLFDALIGNNNAILFNSDYYRALLFMGVLLAAFTILFNWLLIPEYGLNGAAFATFIAICIYNTIKLIYVKRKFNIMPFTIETAKIAGLLVLMVAIFYFVEFTFNPLVNIVLKSVLISVVYVGILYRFKISEDVFGVLSGFLGKKEK
ncbi:polysaccharide biosynthesis C-terminal domain-containing protein [uncultured Eudoraea sp.]|uniref:oligosaccharide flippase family protein n=1 Tax=uncultured Eudoraea sp. TaxID=1035614 RepID=UPI00260E031B|nr:polysaccharide biosynthesis C-terminal domain-containing protein [uncultured Eudoraea sp.]